MLSFLSSGLISLAVFFLGGAKVPLWSRQIPVWHCQIPVWHRQCSCSFGNLCMAQFLACGHKKSLGACARQTFNSLLSLWGFRIYSAATVSVAVLSAATAALSVAAATSSVAGAAVSVVSAFAALLPPQDAKDTATMATAIKTNFFIFFAF